MDASDLKWLFWLLPVLFLLHNLEEIVMLAPWLRRHRPRLAELALKVDNQNKLATQESTMISYLLLLVTHTS
jgi:hypothetical protein